MSEETWDDADAKKSSDQVRENGPAAGESVMCAFLLLSNGQLH